MDKKRSFLNISISIAFKILLLAGSLFVRRLLIDYLGNDVNGLNSLYTSIIGILAVAELGVGSAISFAMYKPIVEKKEETVGALYHLFNKLYWIIGGFILVAGLALTPALPYLAKDYAEIDINVYLTFILMLISVVLTYAFSAKTSLINAYKNNYVTTTINSIGMLLQYGLQILLIYTTKSYVFYLAALIASTLFQWILTEIVSHKRYGKVMKANAKIDSETKTVVIHSVKGMFMHKIGGVLVNTVDSVVISAFIGVAILGKYSNYTAILSGVTGVICLFFTSLSSVIGHTVIEQSKEKVMKYLSFFQAMNFIIGVIFFLGYYAIIDDLIYLFFGDNLQLSKIITYVITLNGFIQFMRYTASLFKDATGAFYNDRFIPLLEGAVNLGLSILFVFVLPEEFNVVGVIIATIITNLLICHIEEPYFLFKYGLKTKANHFYLKNYLFILAFALLLTGLHFSLTSFDNHWLQLLINGLISVGFSAVTFGLLLAVHPNFRQHLFGVIKEFFSKMESKLNKKAADLKKKE